MLNPAAPDTARARFDERFGRRRAVLAVIHVSSHPQTLDNAAIAHASGCDGVFLINHAPPPTAANLFAELQPAVKAEFPSLFCGVNCLDLQTKAAMAQAPELLDGLWCDNAEVDERYDEQPAATAIATARQRSVFKGLYFGGVAFKYQRRVDDLALAAHTAARYVDVVTTSGTTTGSAPAVAKLTELRSGLADHPLAVASGVTPANATLLAEPLDAVLVATGISTDFETLNETLTTELVQAVRSLGPRH